MRKPFQVSGVIMRWTAAGVLLAVGVMARTPPAWADNYQRLSAVDCTMGEVDSYTFDHAVISNRLFARNLDSEYKEFFCAIPMESNLDTDQINAITLYGYVGHTGTSATSFDEDIAVRGCATIGDTGGACTFWSYSANSLGYQTISVGLAGPNSSNIFADKTGYRAYLRVTLPGVDDASSRITGFYITYDEP
jgi:hypothetical protein